MGLVLQLSIKQELKLSEPGVQIKKDKKAVKDLMVCPKKKKRKQRSPAKVENLLKKSPLELLSVLSSVCCAAE